MSWEGNGPVVIPGVFETWTRNARTVGDGGLEGPDFAHRALCAVEEHARHADAVVDVVAVCGVVGA